MKKSANGKSPRSADDVADCDQLPTAPDGGWGWVVVFGSFMVHVLTDGIAYSFGIYVEDFVDYFECSRSEVGTLGSLMIGVTWGSGPIGSILVNKFGCKFVSILGTGIAAAGFIMSIFAPNIYFMYFSFGVVAGLGLGLAYLPAIVVVSFYFEKKRSMATGLAVCGSGMGTFIFAPITQALLNEYGWKGTVLIEAGMLLNVVLCGMLFRPLLIPVVKYNVDHNDADQLQVTEEALLSTFNDVTADDDAPSTPVEIETGRRRANSDSRMKRDSERQAGESWTSVKSASSSPQMAASDDEDKGRRAPSESRVKEVVSRCSSTAMSRSGDSRSRSNVALQSPGVHMMTRKDVFYTQSLLNIPMYNDDPVQYHQSMTSLADMEAYDDDGDASKCCGKSNNEVWKTLGELMDFRLMFDVVFVLFACSNFLTSVGFVVPYIFMPARGVSRGLSESQSAWLISSIGISNTIGRVVFGFIADFKCVNRLLLYTTAVVLCGLVSILSSLCYNFVLMISYCFCFGLLIGIYTCLTPIVLVDLLGLAKLSNAFGLILMMGGIGAVVGPPVAGAIFDITNDYNNSFYMMGVCITTSGFMLYPLPCIQRFKSRKDTEMDIALGKTPYVKAKTGGEVKKDSHTDTATVKTSYIKAKQADVEVSLR